MLQLFEKRSKKLNLKYIIDDLFDEDSQDELMDFFNELESDEIQLILDEFKDLKVAKLENDAIHYESPHSKITFHQLLTHTSGFGYDFHHQTLSHLLLQGEIADLLDKEGKFLNAPLILSLIHI